MNPKQLLFPILFILGAIAIPLYMELSVCNGEEKLYKLEIEGRLVDKYLINQTYRHLIFYSGHDTSEPAYASYSDEFFKIIDIGDSLYKESYSDSCTIFKNKKIYIGFDTCLTTGTGYRLFKKVIYGNTKCPCEEQKKIRNKLNSERNNGNH